MPDPVPLSRQSKPSPVHAIEDALGSVPAVFAAQNAVPGAVEAEAALIAAVLADGALARRVKRDALATGTTARGGRGLTGAPAAGRIATPAAGAASGDELENALLEFAARVASPVPAIGAGDVERLRALGATDAQIVEGVQAAALSVFLCVLADGLDGAPVTTSGASRADRTASHPSSPPSAPFVAAEALSPDEFPPFGSLRDALGFVPRVFRAQAGTRRVLEAEVEAARVLLFVGGAPSSLPRELALLAAAAARLDAYACALHAERLRAMGVAQPTLDALVAGREPQGLAEDDAALVRFAEGLGSGSAAEPPGDPDRLEIVAAIALDAFLGAIAAGLGVRPDFRAPRAELEERRTASRAAPPADDPDAPLVAAARAGEPSAFEELLRRHQARVYRTLAGLTGDASEAEDGCQAVFLRAFRGLADFAGAARFSTWLTRIAIREGIDRVRRRHPTERLEDVASDEDFRPSLVDPWVEDPERLYAREEVRRLVHRELARLPVRYRAAVMLRDIEQLSTAEAAAALELPVPTLKTRLLRGRLLLREALSAHFSQRPEDERV